MAHLVCRLATSARSPILSASADYVPARMDTSAVTTCVVRPRSFPIHIYPRRRVDKLEPYGTDTDTDTNNDIRDAPIV